MAELPRTLWRPCALGSDPGKETAERESRREARTRGAQSKLNDVANALTKEDPTSKIVVEGHTDSQGAAAYNQDLSQHRAQSVRDYLVTRGIASDRISAQGFGSTRSVADNASPEGRADNRRVEIVVQPSSGGPR